jgi:hypothetical protein
MPLAPVFAPASGWYRGRGLGMPGSQEDLQAKAAAAWPCFVFLMRVRGLRLPAVEVARLTPTHGLLLCESVAVDDWSTTLYGPNLRTALLFLANAQLVRDRDECRLFQGLERDAGGKPQWRQTWLCTPTVARGRAILATMAENEQADGA